MNTLCREFGVFELGAIPGPEVRDYRQELIDFFREESEINKLLDTVDIAFQVVNTRARTVAYLQRGDASILSDDAITELNERFREHNLGYSFNGTEISMLEQPGGQTAADASPVESEQGPEVEPELGQEPEKVDEDRN